jgi:hypothetical protein
LGAIRQSDGEFYRMSATRCGDRLTVRRCGGERGVFGLSVGNKQIRPLDIVGSLALKEPRSRETILLLDENGAPRRPEEGTQSVEYRLPAGDYRPLRLVVDCGDLRMSLRSDFTLTSGVDSKPAGMIEIRKNKPYVLDFATKPEVYFRAPSAGEIFKPGDQVWLGAMLRVPHKGLLINGLEDKSKQIGEDKWTAEDGTQMTLCRYASLDPTVVITDSSGTKVAQGTMPFG